MNLPARRDRVTKAEEGVSWNNKNTDSRHFRRPVPFGDRGQFMRVLRDSAARRRVDAAAVETGCDSLPQTDRVRAALPVVIRSVTSEYFI